MLSQLGCTSGKLYFADLLRLMTRETRHPHALVPRVTRESRALSMESIVLSSGVMMSTQ